eukprot:3904935-Prymnesium_polylepis.1
MNGTASCHVPLLVEQLGSAECVPDVTFGCSSEAAMWVRGCAGRFHCGRARKLLLCGSTSTLGRLECTCALHDAEPQRVRALSRRGGRADLVSRAATAPRSIEQLPNVYLAQHWQGRGVYKSDVDRTEEWLGQQSRYVAPGAFRAKLVNGSLWVKMIHVRWQWLERTSVLRLLLMATSPQYRHRGVAGGAALPDVDFAYVQNDGDPNPLRGWVCPLPWPRPCDDMKLPLFTNARHGDTTTSIPLPDFSWVGWNTHTPPWCALHQQMAAAGAATPWVNRTALGYFSGGLRSGNARLELKALAQTEEAKAVLRVRDVSPSFYTLSESFYKEGRDAPDPMSAACGYKYLLSVPGFGYSNRLKALLLCGAAVVHVEPRNSAQEFFRPLLVPGRHLIVVPSVRDILPALQMLRANESLAQRIGRAGRRLALSQLTMGRTLLYVRALLSSFSSVQRERVRLEPGYTRIASAEDAGRLARSCACAAPSRVCPDTGEPLPVSPGMHEGRRLGRVRCVPLTRDSNVCSAHSHQSAPVSIEPRLPIASSLQEEWRGSRKQEDGLQERMRTVYLRAYLRDRAKEGRPTQGGTPLRIDGEFTLLRRLGLPARGVYRRRQR